MSPPGSDASIDSWLAWLETLSPADIELGLDRVDAVLARLALPRPQRIITVGGTNGKGSSVAMLEALFAETGQRVGAFSSPHVIDYGERIRIDRVPSDPQLVIDAFERVEAERRDVPLTYFEYGTLAALCAFAAADVETMILEVGLGGRLDAVNAVDADASLITNVSLDHCEWLGDDIESIAREKAGIMRAGRPVIFGSTTVPRAISSAATRTGAELWLAGRDFMHSEHDGAGWDWSGRQSGFDDLQMPSLPGAHQLDNAAAALAVLEAINALGSLTSASIDRAMSGIELPGRMQQILALERRWLLDGAHNPAGAAALAHALPGLAQGGRVIAVIGVLDDKDSAAMIRALAPVVDRWVAITAETPRAISAGDLARQVAAETGKPCRVAESPTTALASAHAQATADDLLLVAGSFYTVGSALRWLNVRDNGQ